MSSESLKVGVASFIGTIVPASSLFLDGWEPLFKILALLGQIVVAGVTSLYIFAKWRAVKKSKHDDENS